MWLFTVAVHCLFPNVSCEYAYTKYQSVNKSKPLKMKYPSPLSDAKFDFLIAAVKDWQITHGSLLKVISSDEEYTVLSRPVGVTLFPTLFPNSLFQEALALQRTYNKLYTAVAEDEEWLFETLKDLIDVDPLANKLWRIHQEVKQEGYIQGTSLGVFRSDYMLQLVSSSPSGAQLKQVEFNTVACAGGTHSNIISSMHRHLQQTGTYQSSSQSRRSSLLQVNEDMLPASHTVSAIASGLESAYRAYGYAKSKQVAKTCILMIVQPRNFNIADERPIEYALWDQSIPNFRVTFGYEVLSHTSITPNGELLYQPPYLTEPMEVSVVYFRAGFEAHEYDDMGHMARFQLEKSRAIKCPSLLAHLTTFKKVQQALTLPGSLKRFLATEEAALISSTFVPIYPLDHSKIGDHAKRLALDPGKVNNYILKPSLEGGGHNVHGKKIPEFLNAAPKENWKTFVLMEKINPPVLKNFLMSPNGLHEGSVISELGVYGVCLWKRKVADEGDGPQEVFAEIMQEQEPSWSFKTKDARMDEISVVKGFGCFDSPALVDDETFAACLERS